MSALAENQISVFRPEAIRDYILSHVKKPKFSRQVGAVVDPLEALVRQRVSGFRRFYRSLTLNSRIYCLAYHWLLPETTSPRPLSDLSKLSAQLGLSHMQREKVVGAVLQECNELVLSHHRLS